MSGLRESHTHFFWCDWTPKSLLANPIRVFGICVRTWGQSPGNVGRVRRNPSRPRAVANQLRDSKGYQSANARRISSPISFGVRCAM